MESSLLTRRKKTLSRSPRSTLWLRSSHLKLQQRRQFSLYSLRQSLLELLLQHV